MNTYAFIEKKQWWKPITGYRVITKGRNKGKYEVTLANGKRAIVTEIRST